MPSKDDPKKWGQLIAKAWEDDKLRQRLLSDPSTVLKEHGIDPPHGVEIRVVENTERTIYLTLPSKPQLEELRDMELDSRSRGAVFSLPCWIPWW